MRQTIIHFLIGGLQLFPRDSNDKCPGSHVGRILLLMVIQHGGDDVICKRSIASTARRTATTFSLLLVKFKLHITNICASLFYFIIWLH